MAQVTLRNIRKNYGPGGKGGKGGAGGGASPNDDIIKGVDLEVRDGEFLVFVGPSGCGKSTMLRMIAGLEEITSGELRIDGVLANDLRPADRGAAMVFQSYALYPHMTVAENMGFSLKMAGVPKAERSTMVGRAAEVLGIGHMLARYPKELSGGERQRVAIGRAIVRKPKVFLFDEPLSNLDAALRVNMRIELSRLHKELGATMIYVTHDQVEAMTMGDRIAVFNKGRIEQLGAPMELYTRPANEFVATFLGAPCINLVDRPASGAPASAHHALWRALGGEQQAGARRLGLRPEHLHLAGAADSAGQADATDKAGLVPATVELAEHLGDISILHLRVEGVAELLHAKVGADHAHCAAGQTVMLRPEPGRALAFGADGKRI